MCREGQLYIKKVCFTERERKISHHTVHKTLETSAVGQKRENYLKRNQSHLETATEEFITGLIADPIVTFRTWLINVNLNHLITLVSGTRT